MTIRQLTDALLELPVTYGHLKVIVRVGDVFAEPIAFIRPTAEEAATNDPPAIMIALWPPDAPPEPKPAPRTLPH